MNLTLTQRLSLVFSALLLACCGASAWLQIRANHMHEEEVVQGLSRGLAEHIAHNTQLMDVNGLKPEALRRLFGQLMVVNPSVEVYLLDNDGRIIGDDAPAGHLKRTRVDLAPVRRLLAGAPLPVFGDDPRSASVRKVFSAAPLPASGQDAPVGYIYVVLQGEARDRLAARLATSAVLRTTLWSMALVALLGLVAGLLAFGWITRPLRRLTDAMRRFNAADPADPANAPPLPSPSSAHRRDEIAVLETAFGQMANRIGEQWRTLARQDQDRRELVANISHDLRTPLASLHGYLETLSLKADTLSEIERRRYLGIALDQSRKVGNLAQSLFELARLEHGVVQPVLEDFSLADLVQDVFEKFELAAEARCVRLSVVLPPDLPAVTADLGMIERVLTNLLDNAIRHTPTGGTIEVALERRGDDVAVTVSDTGPGIALDMREHLFHRPFTLGDTRRQGGLGLLTVRRILELHQRRIRLIDIEGKGAVFCFELPVAR